MVPWAHLSWQPKWHLDRFVHFCTAHHCVQQTDKPHYVCSRRPHLCTPCMRCGLKMSGYVNWGPLNRSLSECFKPWIQLAKTGCLSFRVIMQATCYLTDTTLCTSRMFAGHWTSGVTISHHTEQCNVVTPSVITAGCPLNRDYDTIRPWVHCTTSCVTINAGRLSHHVFRRWFVFVFVFVEAKRSDWYTRRICNGSEQLWGSWWQTLWSYLSSSSRTD